MGTTRKLLLIEAANINYSIKDILADKWGIGVLNAVNVLYLAPDANYAVKQQVMLSVNMREWVASASGNLEFELTAAGMTGSPITDTFAIVANDTEDTVAEKLRLALVANANIDAWFTAVRVGNRLFLEVKAAAAHDATMNLALSNDSANVLTATLNSVNVTAGAAAGNTAPIAIGDDKMQSVSDGSILAAGQSKNEPLGTKGGIDLSKTCLRSGTALQHCFVDIFER